MISVDTFDSSDSVTPPPAGARSKRVTIIATGGTLAGRAPSKAQTVGYEDAALSVQDLLAACPGLDSIAAIQATQFSNVGSEYINSTYLLQLRRCIDTVFAEGNCDGVVVTHGTDTVEETAMFLDVTYKGQQPIVLVSAMRPSTALSADGPFNLMQAVALAASDQGWNRGVMMVWSNRIGSAKHTTKVSNRALDAFDGYEYGLLGIFLDLEPIFYQPCCQNRERVHFDVTQWECLPEVAILYGHQGMNVEVLRSVASSSVRGIVIACTGDGTLPRDWEEVEKDLLQTGFAVVRSSRVGSTYVAPRHGSITAGLFNPQKARLLLQLALKFYGRCRTDEIQRVFDHRLVVERDLRILQ